MGLDPEFQKAKDKLNTSDPITHYTDPISPARRTQKLNVDRLSDINHTSCDETNHMNYDTSQANEVRLETLANASRNSKDESSETQQVCIG